MLLLLLLGCIHILLALRAGVKHAVGSARNSNHSASEAAHEGTCQFGK